MGSGSSTPPPPPGSLGYSCGGFFFTLDPNIGLWNDKVNPTYRLSFTDKATTEKQRVPYKMMIQHRGPHFDLALRFQFGFVHCDGTFAAAPQTFDVENSWEVAFPLPLWGLRLVHTQLTAIGQPEAPPVTVYCVDTALGLCGGVQRSVSGVGVKGIPDHSWRGDAALIMAMVGFIAAILSFVYNFVMLPSIWRDFIEEMQAAFSEEDADAFTEAAFAEFDKDGDGFISRNDLRQAISEGGLESQGLGGLDADRLFDMMDVQNSGYVSFEDFQVFFEEAMAASQQAAEAPLRPQGGMPGFGGMPGLNPGPLGGGLQPFGGAFGPMDMGVGYRPQAPTHAGPRFPGAQ